MWYFVLVGEEMDLLEYVLIWNRHATFYPCFLQQILPCKVIVGDLVGL